MDDKLFQQLKASIREMKAVEAGHRRPSRVFTSDAIKAKAIRERLKMSQSEFALLIGVSVDTVQNWEQGRTTPTGPARALLKVVASNPHTVLEALHDAG